MTATDNQYMSSLGELVVTPSAADVAAMSELTTAEALTINCVREFRQQSPAARTVAGVNVTATEVPLMSASGARTAAQWRGVFVDDHFLGSTGEHGTDTVTAYTIFKAYWTNNRAIPIAVTPAGGTTGMKTITLNSAYVESVTEPGANADARSPEEFTVMLRCANHTVGSHA